MINNLNGKVAKQYIKAVYDVELYCDVDDKLYLKNTTDKRAKELQIDAWFNTVISNVGETFFEWECEECSFDDKRLPTIEEYSLFCAMVDAWCENTGITNEHKIKQLKDLILEAQKPEHALDFMQYLLGFLADVMSLRQIETIH